jgi:L-Lysine epsilon oxidase N-terminal/L-lysine epsilon oxidase C-terminal domain
MVGSDHVFRVHPAIGFVRVGNSEAYYLAPETMAGLPVPGDSTTTGGLPIRPGTESETITSGELRDRDGALKRQAARFRIFQYPRAEADKYPSSDGTEIKLGSVVDGKRVTDIIWTAHIANKKANCYAFNGDLGIALYEKANAGQLKVRNPAEGADLGDAARLKRLVIDPGPRAIRATDHATVKFDEHTPASCWDGGAEIKTLPQYPQSFPDHSFARLYSPTGNIDSLGELSTDREGRLIVLGGHGKACGWYQADGTPYPLATGPTSPGVLADLNENGWFDDSADGPVSAVLVFDDGSVQTVHAAWVVTVPPSFAPQCLNVVSLWDDVYDTWIRKLGLRPEIFADGFKQSYESSFDTDIFPIFRATSLQRWNINLPQRAIEAHDAVGSIQASDDPGDTILAGLAYIRDPNDPKQFSIGAPFMPLGIGDAGKPFLAVTLTQYFFLTQWSRNCFRKDTAAPLGFGELLDKTALINCMGGGYGPGLEMTFIVRDPELYQSDWRKTGAGPFRIRARALDYNTAKDSQPFLTVGYVPFHPGPDGVLSAPLEPGDATKFMSLPWHGDFNACATHNTDPNPRNSTTLYWAWPAQRPMQIHRAEDVRNGELGPLRYSVRGNGTLSTDLGTAGRYHYDEMITFILNWHRIGTVIQGSAIAGDISYSPLQYLEVASQLDDIGSPPDPVEIKPWPMNSDTPDE